MQLSHGICIHAHFYQPPREDPWLDAVLKDPTAAPYHDWNACVYEQCYRPNRAARLVDTTGRIVYITNNYRHISFNVGPTLHAWIDRHDGALSEKIAEADRMSADACGAGNAIAQAYNHMILPLADDKDVKTQVLWGIRDFAHRFGRSPRGMWLPETAVDTRSLEALAAAGIEFTILAPHQCAAVRRPDGVWQETPGGTGLDVTRPYKITLPSGRKMVLVFYYGGIAHDIAFGSLLDSGDRFADALLQVLPRDGEPRLLVIATDGETYGHHHRFGEMALARASQKIFDSQETLLTNIPSFLDKYPAKWECRIAENTSWSCAHGVERWRSDCGCHTGGEPGWHQAWRAPLRKALDRLRDRIDEIYEREMGAFCDDPWGLRDEAIGLYLGDRSDISFADELYRSKADFLKSYCGSLTAAELRRSLCLVEMQRMRMFMYTSCGWFFNDIAGIETRQVLAYALRAAEYARELTGSALEEAFLGDLKQAIGNTQEYPTGYDVMTRTVLPARRDIGDIAAEAALLGRDAAYYTYAVESGLENFSSGDLDLAVGDLSITDSRTLENWCGAAAVITTGGLDDVCRCSPKAAPDAQETRRIFYGGDILSLSKYIENAFPNGPWRLDALPSDDRAQVVETRMKRAERGHLEHAEDLLTDNQRLLVQLNLMGVPASAFLVSAAEFVFSHKVEELNEMSVDILELLSEDSELHALLQETHALGISPDLTKFAPRMERAFRERIAATARSEELQEDAYARLLELWKEAADIGLAIDDWRLQNWIWRILEENQGNLPGSILEFASLLGFAMPEELEL